MTHDARHPEDQISAAAEAIEVGDHVRVCHGNFGRSEWRVIGRNVSQESYDLLAYSNSNACRQSFCSA